MNSHDRSLKISDLGFHLRSPTLGEKKKVNRKPSVNLGKATISNVSHSEFPRDFGRIKLRSFSRCASSFEVSLSLLSLSLVTLKLGARSALLTFLISPAVSLTW